MPDEMISVTEKALAIQYAAAIMLQLGIGFRVVPGDYAGFCAAEALTWGRALAREHCHECHADDSTEVHDA